MKIREQIRGMLGRSGAGKTRAAAGEAERRTLALPSILSPVQAAGRLLPKPTPVNLRRFAETPLVRRAINVIKDRVAAMDWQVRACTPSEGCAPGERQEAAARQRALRLVLEEPNPSDSFRTLIEQAIEDALTGGYGAIEMECTGDPARPAMLWAVDGASIRINGKWDGDPETPRYAQVMPGQSEGGSGTVELRDDQLMYIRMKPRPRRHHAIAVLFQFARRRHGEAMAASLRGEQSGVSHERYSTAQSNRSAADAGRRAAAQCGRNQRATPRERHQHRRQHERDGPRRQSVSHARVRRFRAALASNFARGLWAVRVVYLRCYRPG